AAPRSSRSARSDGSRGSSPSGGSRPRAALPPRRARDPRPCGAFAARASPSADPPRLEALLGEEEAESHDRRVKDEVARVDDATREVRHVIPDADVLEHLARRVEEDELPDADDEEGHR